MTEINTGQVLVFMGETAVEILLKVLLALTLIAVIGKFVVKKKPGMTLREAAAAVSGSDVVAAHQESVCVAIRYDKNKAVPYVAAKGKGRLAREILAAARNNDVAIVEDKSLATTLFNSIEAGRAIPASHYKRVAEILTHACRLKHKTTV